MTPIEIRQAILDELKTQENLKKSILEELGNRNKIYKFFEHPAILLILGSILTGGVATALSYYWQSQQKEREQALVASQKAVEQKYQLTNDVAKLLGEIHASTLSVLSAMQLDSDSKRAKELSTVVPEWKKSKLEARVRSSVLLEQLTINFGPEARSDFKDILTCYQYLNVGLSNMAEVVQANRGRREKDMEEVSRNMTETLNSHINGILTDRMMSKLAGKFSNQNVPSPMPVATATPTAIPSSAAVLSESNAPASISPNPFIDPCRFNVHYENLKGKKLSNKNVRKRLH